MIGGMEVFDRILSVELVEFDKLTERFKWRFYEIINEDQIRVEVPKGDDEVLVLYLGNIKAVVDQLKKLGFIEQRIKQWREW